MKKCTLADGLALVFDLDGVIVDSMPLHTEVWRTYLGRFGITCDDIEARMHGRRNDDLVADFFGADLTPVEIAEHGAAKETLYRAMMRLELRNRIVPGVPEFLGRYADTPLAIASNAERANVDLVLNGTHLRERFRVIVDGMQVENPKPFPDIYLKAADMLGVEPRNCIVFEDSPAGITAARRAGARVVGVETHGAVDDVDFRTRDFREPQLDVWLLNQQVL